MVRSISLAKVKPLPPAFYEHILHALAVSKRPNTAHEETLATLATLRDSTREILNNKVCLTYPGVSTANKLTSNYLPPFCANLARSMLLRTRVHDPVRTRIVECTNNLAKMRRNRFRVSIAIAITDVCEGKYLNKEW